LQAGLEGFEPPTSGFGDRRSSQFELQACASRKKKTPKSKRQIAFFFLLFAFCFLSSFLVRRVLFAEAAVLFKLHSRRVRLFIFRHRIIAPLALAAFQGDDFSHLYNLFGIMTESSAILRAHDRD
jgi:hypothetical protein